MSQDSINNYRIGQSAETYTFTSAAEFCRAFTELHSVFYAEAADATMDDASNLHLVLAEMAAGILADVMARDLYGVGIDALEALEADDGVEFYCINAEAMQRVNVMERARRIIRY